jgi:hypothetical protein
LAPSSQLADFTPSPNLSTSVALVATLIIPVDVSKYILPATRSLVGTVVIF